MNRDIAIIGIAGYFPDAGDLRSLRHNLQQGVDSIGDLSTQRREATALPTDRRYLKSGYLQDIECFDHAFFGISLAEARDMDPHQRLQLQSTYHALESAGYTMDQLRGSNTAVFMADTVLEYYQHAEQYSPTLSTGNTNAFTAARLSRQFGWRGNCLMIDTTCSSSLVCVHQACQELILEEADYALATAAYINIFPYLPEYGLELDSSDGKSRAFSAHANGMSYGEAVATVLLKPYAKAMEDGDPIHAVISGTAVNNNSDRSASPTAPDSIAQAEVIQKAWQKAGVPPQQAGYIEAHGSGTKLGDSIEVGGLNAAIGKVPTPAQRIPMGTIKSNLGHTRTAAGLTGLLKTVLSLKHQELYPTIHFEAPSELINFEEASVQVNTQYQPWDKPESGLRYAGVSSVGLSGTNCHVVLKEHEREASPSTDTAYPLMISAPDTESLTNQVNNLADYLSKTQDSIQDISYTLWCKRQHHPMKVAVQATTLQEGIAALQGLAIPQQNPSEVPTLLVVESGDGDIEKSLTTLAQLHPGLAPHVAACQATSVGITPQNAAVAMHYVLYQGLQEMGIDTRNLLPVGLGKISAQLFQGQLSLEEALQTAENTADEPLADLPNRVAALRSKRLGDSHLVIGLGHPGPLMQELSVQCQDQPGIRTATINPEGSSGLGAIMIAAFQAGIEVTGTGYYASEKCTVVDLPPYAFLPKRVWLRDTPKEELRNETSLESSTPSVLDNPRHSMELGIATIWAEVLAIPSMERGDNFFELGGDSLKATRVIQQVNEQFGLRLDFEDLFDFPTLVSFAQYVVETSPAQQIILSVWQEVLLDKDIGPQDNFFEKGGHSLLASQIISKVNQILGVKLDFNIFYQHPSVEAMAQYLESTPRPKEEDTALADAFASQSPLTPNHQALWLGCLTQEGMRAYNQPNVYRLKGSWNHQLLHRAFELLVERHDMLRTTIRLQEGKAQLEVHPAAKFLNGIHRIDAKSETRDSILLTLEESSRQLMAYETGPLFDLQIMDVDDGETWLYLNLHHLIADGWSMRILSSEFFSLYQSLKEGKSASLPSLPMTFAGYSQGVAASMQAQLGTKSQAFWEEQLQRSVHTTLPHDIDHEENLVGTRHQISLPAHTLTALKLEAERHKTTLFTMLLSAVALLLHKTNEQNRITVGSPLAGRDEPATQGIVGYFVNVVPITLDIPNTLSELLDHTKIMMREVLTHQQYPVSVMENYQPPQVTVVLQNTLNANLGEDGPQGIETIDLPNEFVTAKTDLRIEAYELDTLYINLDYRTDRYESKQIEGFGVALLDALDQMAGGAQISLSEYDLIGWVPQNAALRAQFDDEF